MLNLIFLLKFHKPPLTSRIQNPPSLILSLKIDDQNSPINNAFRFRHLDSLLDGPMPKSLRNLNSLFPPFFIFVFVQSLLQDANSKGSNVQLLSGNALSLRLRRMPPIVVNP